MELFSRGRGVPPPSGSAAQPFELTKTFTADEYRRALESWDWLPIAGRVPICTSLFGDLFLQGDDGIWFLDTLEGSLQRCWSERQELAADLATEVGQDRYLLGGLAMAAHSAGMILATSQVYDFTVPPRLGGSTSIENVTVLEFGVALHIAGQLHRQVRDLPPGRTISELKVLPPES